MLKNFRWFRGITQMINHQLKCTVKGLKRSSIKIEFISEVCVKKCVCQDPEVHSEIGSKLRQKSVRWISCFDCVLPKIIFFSFFGFLKNLFLGNFEKNFTVFMFTDWIAGRPLFRFYNQATFASQSWFWSLAADGVMLWMLCPTFLRNCPILPIGIHFQKF